MRNKDKQHDSRVRNFKLSLKEKGFSSRGNAHPGFDFERKWIRQDKLCTIDSAFSIPTKKL